MPGFTKTNKDDIWRDIFGKWTITSKVLYDSHRMKNEDYQPERYWDKVAENIGGRDDMKPIAGDDEPYYRYKREQFLKLLNKIDFEGKKVLEVGSGPGANLEFLTRKGCKEIVGVDISGKMIELSKRILRNKNVQVRKIDGYFLPFDDSYFDIVFTSTVLQHNTNETQLKSLIKSICDVSDSEVIIFERIERKIVGHGTNLGRPVQYYKMLFKDQGYTLIETKFLPIQASYFFCGTIRKLFNRRDRNEGEPVSKISFLLESIVLPISSLIDRVVPSKRDLGMLRFKKER
jgi:SAM-dependent methyltransferase